jgi:hypothetical protein
MQMILQFSGEAGKAGVALAPVIDTVGSLCYIRVNAATGKLHSVVADRIVYYLSGRGTKK